MTATIKTREARARRQLNRQGYTLHKSRATHDNQGGYMIVHGWNNTVAAGERFEMSLEDVERFASE